MKAEPFGLAPAQALAFFRRKGLKTSFAWQDVTHQEHDHAFTVAKMLDLDLLRDVKKMVDQALAEGMTLRDFQKQLQPLLETKGWWGRKEMVDPETGEVRDVQLGSPRRLRTIFQTNLATAYAAGQWAQIVETSERAPWLMYTAVHDNRTRPEHMAWDGRVLRFDDPWWQTHYPPNGWNCRCDVIQLNDRQVKKMGLTPLDQAPDDGTEPWTNPRTGEERQIPRGIDPGWDYHPGRDRDEDTGRLADEKVGQTEEEFGLEPGTLEDVVNPPVPAYEESLKALEEMGVTADLEDDPVAADLAVRAFTSVQDAGFDLPAAIDFDPSRFTSPDQVALYTDDQISLNPAAEWEDPAAIADGQGGYWAGDDPEYPIVHETGHHNHRKSVGREVYRALINQALLPQARQELTGKVSELALERVGDFIAEVFATIVRAGDGGKSLDPVVAKWYDRYGGPRPKP